jgi:hypothetical protein
MNTDKELKNDTFPFQAGVFEIQDQADLELGDAKIIQHFAALVVSDAVNDFGVRNHGIKRNKVRDELADLNATEMNRETALLVERDAELFETNDQAVLIDLLIQSVANFVQDLKGQSNDLLRLVLQQQLGIAAVKVWLGIRVHPCPSVVELFLQQRVFERVHQGFE